MLMELEVGQITAADSTNPTVRGTRDGGMAIAQSNPRFWDSVVGGDVFCASLQAATSLGTALTATAVTFTLYNPSFNKNLVIMQTQLAVVVATTAGFVVYAINGTQGQGSPTVTTPLASGIQNSYVGGSQAKGSVAVVYSAATLPATPIARRVLAGIVSTTPGNVHTIVDNVDGAIVLGPGMMATIQGITTNATGVISMTWAETFI